jgi:hypothetical protein
MLSIIAAAPSEKTIVVAGGFISETEVQSSDTCMDTVLLQGNHEEADTRVILHCIHTDANIIVVTARDTDILVLLLAHFKKMTCLQLWLKAGTIKNPKYVPVHSIRNQLSLDDHVYETIPAFHAITGSDTGSYFSGHSKKTEWNVFLENHHLLRDLGKSSDLSKYVSDDAERFICRIYKVISENCNQARVKLFRRFQTIESMPPSSDAAKYHIQRANYQSLIWREACNPNPAIPSPTESGWKLTDGVLSPILTSLPPIPKACKELVQCGCTKGCQTNSCSCRNGNLSCTEACKCCNNETPCRNRNRAK